MTKNFLIGIFLLLSFAVIAQAPPGYYSTATGTGATLKTQLYNIIKGHTSISYDALYTAYLTTDKKSNGKVWDMYSDIPGGTPPYEFSFSTDKCGTYNSEGDCFNREHSIPQSWFNGASPMYTELFNVLPTDGYVNNRRSNYPYGMVSSPTWTSLNGTKLGNCSYPGYTGKVFEPIDTYKGDFARNYFYMATRYENVISTWHSNSTEAEAVLQPNSFPVFETWFLNMLGDWCVADPVSQKEIDRNNAVYAIQHNRNPYIDHPEFVYLVWGVGGTPTTAPEINLKQNAASYLTGSTYAFGSQASGTTGSAITFTIENTGNSALNLTGTPFIALSGTNAGEFILNQSSTSATVAAAGTTTFTVAFAPTSAGSKTAIISVANNDATGNENPYVINFTSTGTVTTSQVSDIIANAAFSYPANIAYTYYQAADITGGSSDLEVARFTLRDGGAAADADILGTSLSSLSFSLTNSASIRKVALYVDGIETGTEQAGASGITFSGLNITAPDNGTRDISLRVSFNSTVTDNQQFAFTVTSATALVSGSGFAASNAGGAASSTAGDNNRLEVTATKLVFGNNPTHTQLNTAMSPAVTVIAKDNYSNTDLDYTTTVSMTTTGTFSGTSTTAVAPAAGIGMATFSSLIFSATGTGFTLTASSGSLIPTGVSTNFDVISSAPEINIKQNSTAYLSGSTFGFGDQVSGTTGSIVPFTVENLGSEVLNLTGSPVVSISGTNAGEFNINQASTSATIPASGTTSFSVTFSPISQGLKNAVISIANNDNTDNENPYLINLTGTGTSAGANSSSSDIITSATFSYPFNIAYASYQAVDITGGINDIEVARFTLRDGGSATDADIQETTLSSLSLALTNSASIRIVALYVDGIETGTEQAGTSGITFSGLNITAPDNGTKDISVRVSFNSTVTDNQQFAFAITSATALTSGSVFASSNAGGAVSSTAGDNNRIEVTATKYVFSVQPPVITSVNANFGASVQALDIHNNLDLDDATQVTLRLSMGTITSATGNPQALVSGSYTWTDLQANTPGLGITLMAEGDHASAFSNFMTIFAAMPTIHASSLQFSNVGTTSMTVNWTNGNGSKRLLAVKASGSPVNDPSTGIGYNGNSTYGLGATLGNEEFVLYTGTGNTLQITGLTSGITYTYKVFEYNGNAGTENYLTPGTAASQTTASLSTVVHNNQGIQQGKVYFINGILKLEVPEMTGKDAVIRIYTVTGQLICMNRKLMNGVVTETVPSLPGVYIIKVIAGGQVFIGKAVK